MTEESKSVRLRSANCASGTISIRSILVAVTILLLADCGGITHSFISTPPAEDSAIAATHLRLVGRCQPTGNPQELLCPDEAMRGIWHELGRLRIAVTACQRDSRTDRDLCKITIARIEADQSSAWRQWWTWLLVGIVVGGAGATGLILGLN